MEERTKRLLVLAGIGIFTWAAILKKRNRSKTMRVKELYIYPIKSCKGIRVSSITFDKFGIENDRRWVLVDEKGNFIHQRVQPKLALVSTDIDKKYLRICAPRRKELLIPLDPRHLVKKGKCSVWGIETVGDDEGDEAAKWFSEYLNLPNVRLIRRNDQNQDRTLPTFNETQLSSKLHPNLSFVDEHALLMISNASLRGLNRRLTKQGKSPIQMNRFRPNVIIDDDEDEEKELNNSFLTMLFREIFASQKRSTEHVEDRWSVIKIGTTELYATKLKGRCVMTTIDQSTGRYAPKLIPAKYPLHDDPGSLAHSGNLNIISSSEDVRQLANSDNNNNHHEGEEVEMKDNLNYNEPLNTLKTYRMFGGESHPFFGQTFSHTLKSLSHSIHENQPIVIKSSLPPNAPPPV